MSSDFQTLSAACEAAVADLATKIVSITSHRMQCSGFVWRPDVIVTSDEGLAYDGEVVIETAVGDTLPAKIIGRDPSTAIAVLKCENLNRAAVSMSPNLPAVGSLAIAVGAEKGALTAAFAMVSASRGAWQSMRGGEIDARLELDVRLRRSGEGGLAVDAAGQAFGMTVFGPRRRVLVIPAATIDRVASQLQTTGHIPRGYLGLSLQPVRIEDGGRGLMVMSVDPRGPAAASNIHQGDVFVAWNGQPAGNMRSLLRTLGPKSVGNTVAIDVRRGGRIEQTTLKIGERPSV